MLNDLVCADERQILKINTFKLFTGNCNDLRILFLIHYELLQRSLNLKLQVWFLRTPTYQAELAKLNSSIRTHQVEMANSSLNFLFLDSASEMPNCCRMHGNSNFRFRFGSFQIVCTILSWNGKKLNFLKFNQFDGTIEVLKISSNTLEWPNSLI